jgi:hypothetical protein
MLKLVYHFQGTRRKEVRMIQRLRAVIVAVLVGLSVHTALAHQVITAVREGNVRVAVGTSATLTLEGTELDKLQSVLVLLSGRPTPEVTAALGAATRSSRTVRIAVAASAKPGKDYELQATVSGKPPLKIPAAFEAVAADRPATLQPSLPPARVTLPVAPGVRSTTTGAVAMTGVRFVPKSATTGALAMTGLRFVPKSATTGALAMTGLRFVPKSATTGALAMTGLRFVPKSATTGELRMTGLRP